MRQTGCALLILFAAAVTLTSGCTPSDSATTPDGMKLQYKIDTTRANGPDVQVAPTAVADEADLTAKAEQAKWAKVYDDKKEQQAKRLQAERAKKALNAADKGPAPLASKADIDAAKKRITTLKGSVKTAKNGAITSIKLAASGSEDPRNNVSPEDTALFGRLGDLESVSFEGAIFNDDMIAPLANCKKLTSVTINNAEITDAGLETLATLPALTYLDIRRDLKLTNTSLTVLQKMTKLEVLHAHYNVFTNTGMNRIAKVPTLKVVDVRGCSDVSDNGAKYLAKLPLLEELHFRFMITNTGVENLTAAGDHLKFVEFQDCNDIDAGSIPSFQKMTALEGLRFFRCKGFVDDAVTGVLALPLKRLELRDLNVSNAGIAPLKNNTTLKTIELSELASVDAAGLTDALSGLKDLEKISFFSIPFEDSAMATLAAQSPKLMSLQLRAVQITDQSIDSILKLSELNTLDLRENSALSAEALSKLAQMKSLKTLYLKGTGMTEKSASDKFEALKKALPKCRIEG